MNMVILDETIQSMIHRVVLGSMIFKRIMSEKSYGIFVIGQGKSFFIKLLLLLLLYLLLLMMMVILLLLLL